ncbi:TerD family protein [Paraburkholderia humisilvae]|uniref:TerD domain-containing protein n=1 Tax=Paraburkholderia humisilvae TaxID=627669 RepID=A0A6J5DJD7_9BURK|nr:TerD family protein [Paraburkholderia humisilvae]CAB3754053.1 hypothetical protein LMG29542_02233 [Paraburkholderia humisilvae]
MSSLVLNLTKPGDEAPKLALNLSKGDLFKVRLSWDGDTDLDLHAFVATNTGGGAKVSSLDDILSTYNVVRTVSGQQVGTIAQAADRTFSIRGGALVHSPDARDGNADGDDEYIVIQPDRLAPPAAGQLEIPLIAMIHPQSSGKTFKSVANPRVIVEDGNGRPLLNVSLSTEFGQFVGVHMGSIVIENDGASSFEGIAAGFNVDFNGVLEHFS